MRVVLFLLLQISLFSQAQKNINCPEAASRRSVDFSMEMGPIRNQDGDGWCYAYGSSDQLTHWMSKRGMGGVRSTGPDRVSPVALALDETARDRRAAYARFNTDSAGYIQRMNALDAAVNAVHPYITNNIEARNPQVQAACQNVPRDPNGAIRIMRPSPSGMANSQVLDTTADNCDRMRKSACRADSNCSQIMRQAEDAMTARLNLRASAPRFEFPAGAVASDVLRRGINDGMCLESSVASDGFDPRLGVNVNQLLTVNAMTPNCPDCQRENSIRAVFPRFQGNIAAILDNYASVDPMSEFMKSCQRVQIPRNQRPSVVHVNPSDFSRLLEVPNPEPIGVNYSASIFDYASEEVRNSYETPGAGRPERPLHYSLLVGKRYNCSLGEEEFILRNSWGSGSCDFDRSTYLSVPKNDSRVVNLEQDRYACLTTCRPGIHFRLCNERCVNDNNRAKLALHNPPFYCEDGLYIVRASTLVRASHSGNRLE